MRSTPMYLLRWQFACLTLAVLWSKTVAFAVTPTSNSCNQGMMPVACIDWCPRTCRTPQNTGHCYIKNLCLPGCGCPNGTWFDSRAGYCVEEGYCKNQGFGNNQHYHMMSDKLDHFNVLVVCALPLELRAAIRVLENGTESKFKGKHPHLPQLNIKVCDKWMSTSMPTPLKVGMASQTKMGGMETQRILSELARHFSANVVVMTGICAGEEDKYSHTEHGCVIIPNRTTVEMSGKVEEGGQYQPSAEYEPLDNTILASVNELAQDNSDVWLQYVPEDAIRPSPRYLQQLILGLVSQSGEDGITKKELLDKMVQKKLHGMTTMDVDKVRLIYDSVLTRMLEQKSPWISCSSPTAKHKYIATQEGNEYKESAAVFPCKDAVSAIVDCTMATMPNVTENLKEELKLIKERMADRKVKAVDMEAHMFMKQGKDSFGKAVVIKGISNYGTSASKEDYYQVYAASTSAAFLRHLMTVKHYLFNL